MTTDVVIVDDHLSAAQEFERLVTARTGLSVVSTDDPDHALQLVKTGDVAVAVLDERMPQKAGTALFAEMRRVDPRIRGIMLTGEASAEETGRAVAAGYSDYLHKREVAFLGERVLAQFVHRQATLAAELAAASQRPSVLATEQHGRWPLRRCRVEYTLQEVIVVETAVVHPDSWETVLTLTAGETRTDTVRSERFDEFRFEHESVERLRTEVGVTDAALVAIRAGLQSEITSRQQTWMTRQTTETTTTEATYNLPAEPYDIHQIHVRTRHYQRAPSWTLLRATIRRSCSCCHGAVFFVISVHHRNAAIATQHVDHYSDGTTKIVDTGIVRRPD